MLIRIRITCVETVLGYKRDLGDRIKGDSLRKLLGKNSFLVFSHYIEESEPPIFLWAQALLGGGLGQSIT